MRMFMMSLVAVLGVGLVAAGCNDKDRDNVTQTNTTTNPPVTITAQSLPRGEVGTYYEYGFATTGGTKPFDWEISQGSLPSGVYLNPTTGVISGYPTAAGQSNFSIRVSDAASSVSSFATAVTVNTP